ncbi:MAG: FAD-binding protein [Alphaproteobacteria bacterium]|nr:FAD-binding protein [Alphaproteobacteria bacterium]
MPLVTNGFNFGPSRRDILIGGAAVTAMTALPSAGRRAWAADDYDLIVVGAGTAGLPAAIFAAQRGAKVLAIEKSHRLGGTLDRSGARMTAAGTKLQKSKGITDTPDMHYADVMRVCNNTAVPHLVRVAVDNAGWTMDWLMDKGFAVLPDHPAVTGSGHTPDSTPRYQWGKEAGVSVLKILEPEVNAALKSGNLKILFNTDAVELIMGKDGAVAGVVGADPEGKRTDYRARNVALATGGCLNNVKLHMELHNGVPPYQRIGYPTNTGGGLLLGEQAGGYIHGGDKYNCGFGQILTDFNFPSPAWGFADVAAERRVPWEIFVNVRGERFINEESTDIDGREKALGRQPGHRHWVIFNQAIRDKSPTLFPRMTPEAVEDAFNRQHYFTKAASLSELATKAGIDGAGLAKSAADYNKAQASGNDTLGRKHMPMPIGDTGPFYAVRLQGTTLLTYAGLAVDKDLRVMTKAGTSVPNLYAAGEVIGSASTVGNALVNGMAVMPAMTFGRLIGQKLIKVA